MQKQIKTIARVGICAAILIGGQLVLSGIAGIEIVTVLMLCFCFSYSIKDGVLIATTFSLLRCFIFGFFVNVVVLYLIYYTLFAIFFGWLGKKFSDKISFPRFLCVLFSAIIFTIFFTLLDNVLTPLMFRFNLNAAKTYFLASLYSLVPQIICTAVTVSALFLPLTKVIAKIKF